MSQRWFEMARRVADEDRSERGKMFQVGRIYWEVPGSETKEGRKLVWGKRGAKLGGWSGAVYLTPRAETSKGALRNGCKCGLLEKWER